MARDRLQPVARELAGGEIVAADGVHGVDGLAPDQREAGAPRALRGRAPVPTRRGAPPEPGRARAPQGERHTQALRAPSQEREIEAMEVVVLHHVGIDGVDARHEAPQEIGFGGVTVAVRRHRLRRAVGVAQRDEEDPIAIRIEAGRLQIELHPPELVEIEPAEVRPAGGHQVLLFRRERERRARPEIAHVLAGAPEPPRGAAEELPRERPPVRRVHHEAELARPLELTVSERRRRLAGGRLGPQSLTDVAEIGERREQQPRPEVDVFRTSRARGQRRQTNARPSGSAHTETMPGVDPPQPRVLRARFVRQRPQEGAVDAVSFSPMMAPTSTAISTSRAVETGSASSTMPPIAGPVAPMPVQTA